ncbi:hypothetical protein [Stenotrophomonas sp. TD3]|uniref:hypothetical protein n=1 Tax=Stenotrophomonas sp. TD3 TaxID=1641707 RepID=UPI001115138B|nr:hypothetical protein [Stenotrophomonas sp. TD3]
MRAQGARLLQRGQLIHARDFQRGISLQKPRVCLQRTFHTRQLPIHLVALAAIRDLLGQISKHLLREHLRRNRGVFIFGLGQVQDRTDNHLIIRRLQRPGEQPPAHILRTGLQRRNFKLSGFAHESGGIRFRCGLHQQWNGRQ